MVEKIRRGECTVLCIVSVIDKYITALLKCEYNPNKMNQKDMTKVKLIGDSTLNLGISK